MYVNSQGLAMLNGLVQEYPVLLVPSHRSYFDFLIFSIMCFNYDLPLPAIVAAQDFQSMFIVGAMLRNSGAFYIKRTFRSDQLYQHPSWNPLHSMRCVQFIFLYL